MRKRSYMWLVLILPFCASCTAATVREPLTPEEVIRAVVAANADKDFPAMSRFMAQDEDRINYTIGGRKYVGWSGLAADLREEFESVTRLEMPIYELTVWTRGESAWFVMELDYIRFIGEGPNQLRKVLPLRETGVLEQRNGNWIVVAWHESFRQSGLDVPISVLTQLPK